jgi:hypothetical protein
MPMTASVLARSPRHGIDRALACRALGFLQDCILRHPDLQPEIRSSDPRACSGRLDPLATAYDPKLQVPLLMRG